MRSDGGRIRRNPCREPTDRRQAPSRVSGGPALTGLLVRGPTHADAGFIEDDEAGIRMCRATDEQSGKGGSAADSRWRLPPVSRLTTRVSPDPPAIGAHRVLVRM